LLTTQAITLHGTQENFWCWMKFTGFRSFFRFCVV
jgi:predicted glycosyltransferase involved in capsule biosynthesis